MVLRFASLDQSKSLTGLEYLIDDVFKKCVQVAPPVIGSAQLGMSECQPFPVTIQAILSNHLK